MTKHDLIVCKACGATADEDSSKQETDGTRLLNRLQELHEHWPRKDELAIKTTTCLCICERACAIAYVGTHKPTFLFGDLDPATCTADLLTAES
jgi:predicted metal-binding protein